MEQWWSSPFPAGFLFLEQEGAAFLVGLYILGTNKKGRAVGYVVKFFFFCLCMVRTGVEESSCGVKKNIETDL